MKNEALFAANNTDNSLGDGHGNMSIKVFEIFEIMKRLWGEEYVNTAIEKAGLLDLATSSVTEHRIEALQRLILKEDVTVEAPELVLGRVQKELARLVARHQIEESLHEEVDKLIEEKHSKFLDEMKLSILNKKKGPENP